MLKKTYQMQKFLLFNSGLISLSGNGKNKFAQQKYSLGDKLFILILLTVSYLFTILIDSFLVSIISATISTLTIGGFLSYNSDTLSLIPISKRFKFINLNIFCFLIFIINLLILLIPTILYIKNTNLYVFHASANLESALLLFFIVTIFYSIMLTIMFIKNKLLRYSAGLSFSILYLVSLAYFKFFYMKSLNIGNLAFENDLSSVLWFSPCNLNMLLSFGVISMVILTLSLCLSYYIYTKNPYKTL